MGGEAYRCAACRPKAERCTSCRARRATARTALRAQRRKDHLCTECGRKALHDQSRCQDCSDANNARSAAAHAAARREA